ncbi:MAG: TAT-variant-translocated molybdopterin oxidoreductase [Elusimicrobia bacterium]|nr:TAT-variant-translocated molybdopterin oxidoreductase [Elusimicrobiota bacterium]
MSDPTPTVSEHKSPPALTAGKDYWRSLDELADTPAFQEAVAREFPTEFQFVLDPLSRRSLLKVMGASFGMAFLTACRRPLDTIIPYNKAPEDLIPGKPLFFASALPFMGYARGVLVENQMGRPTKIEGGPNHPDGAGTSDLFMQAAVLEMYDPDRSKAVTHNGLPSTWNEFLAALAEALKNQKAKNGGGIRFLTETVTSPTLADHIRRFQKIYPQARWHHYEPCGLANALDGARLAFGKPLDVRYDFTRADVILSLDSDFLGGLPGSLTYARDFAARRRPGSARGMNRLYAVEPMPSVTGHMADHRYPLRNDHIESLARTLARSLGASVGEGIELPSDMAPWVRALQKDLEKNRGASLVLAGPHQPPLVHALTHVINHALGNGGTTVAYSESSVVSSPSAESLGELAEDLKNNRVDLLLVLGGNPSYTAPADFEFGELMKKAAFSARLGLYDDETSAHCQWHIPQAHPLESWGDLRAYDGTVSFVQPQIAPLYDGKTALEVVSALVDGTPRSPRDLVHDYWKKETRAVDFERFWKKCLHDGILAGSAQALQTPVLARDVAQTPQGSGSAGMEIVFRADPTVGDGRGSNNGWLQELPKPVTKLTWDNAVFMGPRQAQSLGVVNEQVVEIEFKGRTVEGPVWIVPGHVDNAVTLSLGYGRTKAGLVGNGVGFNAYLLRDTNAFNHGTGVSIRKTGRRLPLAATQLHFAMDGRDLVREGDLDEFKNDPAFATRGEKEPGPEETLNRYSKPKQSDDYAWGMGIDLNACTGCSACVLACQSENNIPVVGKAQVAKGREMHWIRVDSYYTGDPNAPRSLSQPVPCMHCEDAPCEPVCPVAATSHSEDGLNQMTYNRCIGTRYCSNNCSYKVRRFNFFEYSDKIQGPLKLMQNPDVTVRSRGVMEKCTYCVQRIQSARIGADKQNRLVRDGEITPACAQSCPAQAIVFGNLKDKSSRVSKAHQDPRNYSLLAHLGTRPRTTYQARLRNPNPEIVQ